MVCGWTDGEWGGEVLQAGDGEEGEEWGSVEFGSVESVRRMQGHEILVHMGLLSRRRSKGLWVSGQLSVVPVA